MPRATVQASHSIIPSWEHACAKPLNGKKITGKHNNKEIMNEIHNYIHFALKLFKKAQ